VQAPRGRRRERELPAVSHVGPSRWRVKFAGRAAFECTGPVLTHVLGELNPADRHEVFRRSLAQVRGRKGAR